ncbi:MAG: Holliday junction resolvase RuvX [Bacteroidetes bacterium]|nr:MAG: Holliday junction resolvase RuvX [Bacteroidota bacterium]TAG93060.1 MAG: Holliday junction resolvase RuvX [Bacteroidota bacterium]
MPRILAIDYGLKRTGLAVSDELKIIATALDAISTEKIWIFLEQYLNQQEVETFVVGMPIDLEGNDTDATPHVKGFVKKLAKIYPHIPIHLQDERFTSKLAAQSMVLSGTKKKDRQQKTNLDKISATIILQGFMGV